MAWTTTPYCSLADVKLALGFESTDTADDQWLQVLIGRAQAAIDEYLGFSYQQNVGATNVYDGSGTDTLLIDDCISLATSPTVAVQETDYNVFVGSDGVYQTGTTMTFDISADCILVPVTSYAGYGITLKRKTGLLFNDGTQNYAVTGTWGRPGVPADVVYAAIRLTVHFYKLRSADYGAAPADPQFGSIRMSSAFPKDVCAILDQRKTRGFYGS